MHFSDISSIASGNLQRLTKDSLVQHLLTDSRKLTSAAGCVFFAIKGERHDGHTFLSMLYARGVRCFVVEVIGDLQTLPEANVIQVKSSVDALQKVAAAHRQQFGIPVIGITGSNGKTIVKEWLTQLLSSDFPIVSSPASYNSQIGVPLSVWAIAEHHKLGIFEAGISRGDEMQKLAAVIQPTIGLITNIGPAHDEGFTTTKQKILEKLRLFRDSSVVIHCGDHEQISQAIRELGLSGLAWGYGMKNDIKVTLTESTALIEYSGSSFQITIPFADPASIENALHCIAIELYLGIDPGIIADRMTLLRALPQRLEMKAGINNCQLIDDSYSNDINSLQIGLDFLKHQNQKEKKVVILSDIQQSGMQPDEQCREIARLVAASGASLFIGIGDVLSSNQELLSPASLLFRSTDQFLTEFNFTLLSDSLILIKGARMFSFERIANRLQKRIHGTVMEINMANLVHNLNFFRARLCMPCKVMVMVKALAYGSGSVEIANLLAYHKVDYLGVAYPDEGIDLRRNHITLPIMVMNPSEESLDKLLEFNLEPEVYSMRLLTALAKLIAGAEVRIHLKLDTGMNRLGFAPEDIDELMIILAKNPNIKVISIFSHLAGADDPKHDEFTLRQAKLFQDGYGRIANVLGYLPIRHLINSAGIVRFPEYQMDMVRLGIGLYGVNPTSETLDLRPVASLKTTISQIKEIGSGTTVGYGRSEMVTGDRKIATIAIGYADGFSRAFSNGVGAVLISSKLAPVIGRVCMDMTMVDVTGIEANEGDEVIVFGPGMPIEQLAEAINTIPYEILTNTSERVKRVFLAEGI